MNKQEAIKVLNTYDVYFDGYTAEEIVYAIYMAVEALQDDWIPVSERLPEPDEEVFVYLWGDVPHLASVNGEGQWETDNFYLDADDAPKAWKPLPEPYREEQENE